MDEEERRVFNAWMDQMSGQIHFLENQNRDLRNQLETVKNKLSKKKHKIHKLKALLGDL